MIDDPAKALAFWIAAVMGRPDVCAEILMSAPKRKTVTLSLVASNGHLLDQPVSVTKVRIE